MHLFFCFFAPYLCTVKVIKDDHTKQTKLFIIKLLTRRTTIRHKQKKVMCKLNFFKKATLIAAIALTTVAGSANAQVFAKGDKVAQLGLGLGSYYGYGSSWKMSVPPISASFEYGIVDGLLNDKAAVGVGGYIAYTSHKWKGSYYYGGSDWTWSNLVIGARGLFHYQFVDNLDTYAGLLLGYDSYMYGGTGYTNGGSSGLDLSAFAGARYYFTDSFAAFGELGYGGIAILEIGVAMKF